MGIILVIFLVRGNNNDLQVVILSFNHLNGTGSINREKDGTYIVILARSVHQSHLKHITVVIIVH